MNTDLLFQHFATLATAPDGIARLRELILQFALEGHLIEQDDHDEPADQMVSEFLKSKQIVGKKGKTIQIDERPVLPKGWTCETLGKFIYFAGRIGWRGLKAEEYTQDGPLFLSAHSINESRFVDLSKTFHISVERYEESPEIQLREDDILLVKDGGIGQIGMIKKLKERATINSSILLVRPNEIMIPEFLYFQLKGPRMQKIIKERILGIAVPHLFQKDIKNFLVLIPPLAEQHRIVTKVDRLMALCDEIEARQQQERAGCLKLGTAIFVGLQNAESLEEFEQILTQVCEAFDLILDCPENVAVLRQTILQLAVQGRLVRQEPGDQLAKILPYGVNLIRKESDDKSRKKKNNTGDPINLDGIDSSIIPNGWMICRLSDCLELINGRAYAMNELLSKGTPIIRIQNLNGGNDWYYSNLNLEPHKYCDNGDLLFAWSGTFGPYIWKGSKSIFHYHIWKIVLSNIILKQFVFYLLKHLSAKIRSSSHGLMILHMTKQNMENVLIRLPPLAEQHRIVAKVDALMALCDALEARLKEREGVQGKLSRAVVKQVASV